MRKKILSRYAWLSIAAALATIGFKTSAYIYTNSVGILSDALESFVNLAAAILALWMIKVSERPPDADHEFGHNKAEYFSSAAEGILILLAAVWIVIAAVRRLITPAELGNLEFGVIISLIATAINLVVGIVLIRAGKQHQSIVLEADGNHLLTDVWTTIGILTALMLVWVTGWTAADPIAAIVVSIGIGYTGYKLVRKSVLGLMDTAIDSDDLERVQSVLNGYAESHGVDFHAVRTRRSGPKKFIYFHLLVPDEWTVKKGHDLSHEIEEEILAGISDAAVFIHLEPLHDPASQEDLELFG
ncbi:MAG: cation diffusion facilitator family transporter [Acidobacteriota bacterium]|nr:cation diffusion facilitator family transporter [Acidobacteriota bacterium]MDH3529374.1 cation diffusion facilitator family transporter [Acidobacteriota bacterium]